MKSFYLYCHFRQPNRSVSPDCKQKNPDFMEVDMKRFESETSGIRQPFTPPPAHWQQGFVLCVVFPLLHHK